MENRRWAGRDIGVGGTKIGGVAYTRESDVVGLSKRGDVGMLGTPPPPRSTLLQLQSNHRDGRERLDAPRLDDSNALYTRRSTMLRVTRVS